MDKHTFLNLLRNYSALSADETHAVIQLQEEFPFSQVLHHLAARGAHDQHLANRDYQLHQSAIYATDRAVLKWIMTSPRSIRAEKQADVQPDPAPSGELSHMAPSPPSKDDHLITLEEVQAGVARLKELQLIFEARFASPNPANDSQAQTATATSPIQKSQPVAPVIEWVPAPEPVNVGDVFIQDIQSKEKKGDHETVLQKEQGEIIDQFIKTQPTMPRPKRESEAEQAADLSAESLHHFGESVISETLVEVLLKQGKREKAIEVLKKLIWKFPQKKAYFVAQIEDLKK